MNDLEWLDATAQAELVRKHDVSARELVERAIARIERLNSTERDHPSALREGAH